MSKQFAFNSVPVVKKRRSSFDLSHDVKTSMTAGYLYPIDVQEVYPGDTFKVNTSIVARVSSAFIRPVMDNAFMDVYYFFVPNRLVMDDWSQVMGENKAGAWAQQVDVPVPVLKGQMDFTTTSAGGSLTSTYMNEVTAGTVADYLGLPITETTGSGFNYEASILPFRAFALIYDEWWRDQNNIQPMNINKTKDVSVNEILNNNAWSPTNYTGKLPKACKLHDYFTSCLPAPQKGNAVNLLSNAVLPVHTVDMDTVSSLFSGYDPTVLVNKFYSNALGGVVLKTTDSGDTWSLESNANAYDGKAWTVSGLSSGLNVPQMSTTSASIPGVGNAKYGFAPVNLVSDLSAASVSINDFRYAMALQRMLEKDALGGNRYTEYLLSHFGVLSPDARLQRTELLGGHRFPISVQQVANTVADTSQPLGALGAYSLTNGSARYTKGFVEHGFVIACATIRYFHSYQQGVERFWARKNRLDFYDPVFANIGEQPVYKSELFEGATAGQVFGYNEAWADLRYRPSKITGQMRTESGSTLDIWHFADDYANAPSLNYSFIEETPDNIDRTLAVGSSSLDQFIVDIYHKVKAYRILPVYSTPSMLK